MFMNNPFRKLPMRSDKDRRRMGTESRDCDSGTGVEFGEFDFVSAMALMSSPELLGFFVVH